MTYLMAKFSPFYSGYIKSSAWYAKRDLKMRKSGYKCWWCGTSYNLEVHHLTYERLGRERLSDLMVLCHKHHDWVTRFTRLARWAKKRARAIKEGLAMLFVALFILALFWYLLFIVGVW